MAARSVTDYRDLPAVPIDLAGLTHGWHLWPSWSDGFRTALVRHLDGTLDAPDARFVAVVPFLYTWGVIVGPVVHAATGHDDRWCYKTLDVAVAAAWAWDGRGEPEGWHRHPTSGRRRVDGDATQEYINL